jgi:nitrite reductase/ring-hydroxylating ferredoxin subunit
MHRQVTKLIDRQASWATPLADWAQPLLETLFHEGGRRPYKDLLNGTWLGHPLHPVLTDVPTGAMTLAVLFDATGRDGAADIAVATGVAGMVASAATGAADAVDAYDRPRTLATVHATLMIASATAYSASLLLRLGPGVGRPLARMLGYAGYGAMAAGAYVAGELVYKAGNQVDRHAWEPTSSKWRSLDVTEVPAGTLVKGKAGNDSVLLYRELDGDPVSAFSSVCAHAGGPLDKGKIIDGCVECPWHQSRYDLRTGHVRQGPAVFDQPRYEVRETSEGGLEARRMPPSAV